MTDDIRLENLGIKPDDLPVIRVKCPYFHQLNENSTLSKGKRLKKWVYFLLERPSTKVAVVYHLISLLLILGSLIVSVLSTIEEMENELVKVMDAYESFLLAWFSMEFILRTWSCSYCSRYQGVKGRFRFLFSVYMMIDLFVILSTMTTFIMQINGSAFAILRVTRFMQVFRILRVDRQRGDFKTMGNVVKEHSKELITVYFVGFVIMFAATYIVYLCEKHRELFSTVNKEIITPILNSTVTDSGGGDEILINNMANGLYWAVITVTSVGYGDLSPKTWLGKMICAVFALVGCAFFSLPAGILGSGFALQVAKQKKEKRFVKVRNPAAYVIQTLWRNYSIKKSNRTLEATWFQLLPQLKLPSDETQSQSLESLMRTELSKPLGDDGIGSIFCPAFSMSSFAQEAKPPSNKPSSQQINNNNNNNNAIEEGIKKLGKLLNPVSTKNSDGILNPTTYLGRENLLEAKYRYLKPKIESNSKHHKESYRDKEIPNIAISQKIQTKYKIAIRFIMRLRYWTAIKIFKSVRHPFVNMQDIMEKNAISHVEMLSQIKSMKESFQLLHTELLDLRMSLIELKTDRLKKENIKNRAKSF